MASKKKGGFQEKLHCSFCGKEQDNVRRLVAGPGVYICEECIELCNEIISDESQEDKSGLLGSQLPKPVDIKATLDQYVIGQEEAKKVLSVAVYNHYKRINYSQNKTSLELDKSNILLIGPTGSGKTLLAQTLARLLKVPFAIVDATALTEAGYVGEDVENILLRLIQNADGDVHKAEIGIIYIDEIDKISRKLDNPSITRDVSGEGVQQALLKIIEGTLANVPPQGGRKHPHQDFITINTRNILFICGGAFVGMEQVLENRLGKREIGFERMPTRNKEERIRQKDPKRKEAQAGLESPKKEKAKAQTKSRVEHKVQLKNQRRNELFAELLPDDLMKYGLIPEFVGRLPVVAVLNDLDMETLRQIFTAPKNSLYKQYQKNFELEGVKLKFTQEAVTRTAEKAIEREAGARGLRSIIEKVMIDMMFTIPSRKDVQEIVITPGVIDREDSPVLVLKKTKTKKKRAASLAAKQERLA